MPSVLHSSKLSRGLIAFTVMRSILLNQRDDLLRLEGLGDIFFRASKPGLQSVEETISSRKRDESHVLELRPGFEVLHDLVAIHSRQANINEGNGGDSSIGDAQSSECFDRISITDHSVALSVQTNLKNLAGCFGIVDHQYQRNFSCGRSVHTKLTFLSGQLQRGILTSMELSISNGDPTDEFGDKAAGSLEQL